MIRDYVRRSHGEENQARRRINLRCTTRKRTELVGIRKFNYVNRKWIIIGGCTAKYILYMLRERKHHGIEGQTRPFFNLSQFRGVIVQRVSS